MAKQHYSRHWGSKAAIVLVLAFLLAGLVLFGIVVHTQQQWKVFQLELGLAISDLQRDGGSLQAVSATEEASVCPDNAYNLMKMFQTARAVSAEKPGRRDPAQAQLVLTFGTGEVLTVSHTAQDHVYVHLLRRSGGEMAFRLGKCDFSKMVRITSIEGAAYHNSPWSPT